jgi:threonine/homoserine/homoserine lactone efflux protein
MNNSYILIIRAVYTGLITGIVIAIPMGPAGIESIRWTISKGFRYGIMIAAGSLLADAIDVMLINFGLLELIETNKLLEVFFWMLSGVVIFYIGYKAVKNSKKKSEENEEESLVKKKEEKHRPILTGFIINFSNPMTHFFWLTLSSTVIRVWRNTGKLTYFIFAVSMLTGMFISLFSINFLASKGKKVASPKLSGKFSIFLEYGIAAIGIGFFLYGAYVLYIFIR